MAVEDCLNESEISETYEDAVNRKESAEWKKAMNSEMSSLKATRHGS